MNQSILTPHSIIESMLEKSTNNVTPDATIGLGQKESNQIIPDEIMINNKAAELKSIPLVSRIVKTGTNISKN